MNRTIDLDVFIPEPLTMKVNGEVHEVKEPTTEIYLRILKLGELKEENFEEAQRHFLSIFKETVPTLPEETILNMNGKQISGYLEFLITTYLVGNDDPNAVKPMLNMKNRS